MSTDDDAVSVIETASNTVVATVEVAIGSNGVAITPDGAFAYVPGPPIVPAPRNTVSVIATATNTVVATISEGGGLSIGPGVAQRNPSWPEVELPVPTTIDPSADTARAKLVKLPPVRSPMPSIPPAEVQRKASMPELDLLHPTTTVPSALALG